MGALAEIERLGLRARLKDGQLLVGPKALLTDAVRTLVASLADALKAELGVPPKYRAWRIRRPDGRSGGIVMDPAGMDQAEALKAVDRWPDCTVEALEASKV